MMKPLSAHDVNTVKAMSLLVDAQKEYPNGIDTHIKSALRILKGMYLGNQIVATLEFLEVTLKKDNCKVNRLIRLFLNRATTFPLFKLHSDIQRLVISYFSDFDIGKFHIAFETKSYPYIVHWVNDRKADFPVYFFQELEHLSDCLAMNGSQLKYLSLHYPTRKVIEPFLTCTQIKQLKIHTRDLKNEQIDPLCQVTWPHLEEVLLCQSWDVSAASYIAFAQKITSLNLHTFKFETLNWGFDASPVLLCSIPSMRNLTSLHLNRTNMSDDVLFQIAGLYNLSTIRELHLETNTLTDVSALRIANAPFSNLLTLNLKWNTSITINGISAICCSPHLVNLITFDLYLAQKELLESPFAIRQRLRNAQKES